MIVTTEDVTTALDYNSVKILKDLFQNSTRLKIMRNIGNAFSKKYFIAKIKTEISINPCLY